MTVTATAARDAPPALLDQLAPGGVMILAVGETADTRQLLECRRTEAAIDYGSPWPVRFVPLVGGVENGGAPGNGEVVGLNISTETGMKQVRFHPRQPLASER